MTTQLLLLALAVANITAAAPSFERTEDRADCSQHDAMRRPFFGDLHVHTAVSLDAATQDTRATPQDAYLFAKGHPLKIPPFLASGEPAATIRLRRPLDFMAVTDHAEFFGELDICRDPEKSGHDSASCRIFRRWPRLALFVVLGGYAGASGTVERYRWCGEAGQRCIGAARGVWQDMRAAAEAAYDRTSACRFTSFVGYEWTRSPDSINFHRNVIFRNANVPPNVASAMDAPFEEDLWRRLHDDCLERGNGCDVVVIPHNSNLSAGLMFQTTAPDGSARDAAWARTRAAMEPLVEIMQHKGESECFPGASDEECGFEKLPYDRFRAKFDVNYVSPPNSVKGFARDALKEGLAFQARTGVNPFQFGFIGSTDTHIAAAGMVDDDSHQGHGGAGAPVASAPGSRLPDDIELNPGGLAVLWAEENSRDALFAAMRRREAYATSGPRHVVRLFGGWNLSGDLCGASDLAAQGYAGGVPMGGELTARPAGATAPRFVVSASHDAGTPDHPGAPLERIQIVKGWLAPDGTLHEQVLDVAGAKSATTVDPTTCALPAGGAPSLCTVWTDPTFEPRAPAFYYARVLEVPTCRWSTQACVRAKVDCSHPDSVPAAWADCCRADYPKTVRERSWTSPIWYNPGT